jgi:hypothetical protein
LAGGATTNADSVILPTPSKTSDGRVRVDGDVKSLTLIPCDHCTILRYKIDD